MSSRLRRNLCTIAAAVEGFRMKCSSKLPLMGMLTVALATAATSMALGIAMVARPHKLPACPHESSSLQLHHHLAPIRTDSRQGRRKHLGVSSLAPTSSNCLLDPENSSDLTTVLHRVDHPLSRLETWHLASLNMEFVDLTVTRAAAYDFVFQIPDPRRWGCWVSDQAGVMSGHHVEHINAVLNALSHNTGTEVTVVTIEDISNSSLSSKAFAENLFNHWKMDRESDGNTILLFFVRSQGKLEVEVGRALEKTLRQASLWGPPNGWREGLTSRKTRALLCKGEHGKALMLAIEDLADKVWGSSGLPQHQSSTASPWWGRIRLVDMAWLSVTILILCGNTSLACLWDTRAFREAGEGAVPLLFGRRVASNSRSLVLLAPQLESITRGIFASLASNGLLAGNPCTSWINEKRVVRP